MAEDSGAGSRSRGWAITIAVLMLAFGVRAWDLHGAGFTPDEVAEVTKAHASLPSILLDDDDDRFPQLYRLALALSIRATGSDLASRWLSVLCGVAGVWVTGRAGRVLLGDRQGWLAALLLAVCPFHVHFSRDGRAYALYFLFCALAILATLRIQQLARPRDWLLLSAASLLAVYTHYFVGPLLVVLWLAALVAAYRQGVFKRGVVTLLVTVALVAPAALQLKAALATMGGYRSPAWFDLEAWAYTYFSLVSGFTLGPEMNELREMPTRQGVLQLLPWALAAGAALAMLALHAWRSLRTTSALPLLLTLMIALIPLLGFGGNLTGVGYVYRYVCWIALPFVLLAAAGAAACGIKRTACLGLTMLLVLNGIAIGNQLFNPRYQRQDARAAAELLGEEPARPALTLSPYLAQAINYYLPADAQCGGAPIYPQQAEGREQQLAEFLDRLESGQQYWLLSGRLPESEPRRETRDELLGRLGAEYVTEVGRTEFYRAVKQ